jgi:hypothetical protein
MEIMKVYKTSIIVSTLMIFLSFQLPSNLSIANANFEIVEGGQCGAANAIGPIKGTTTKVTCVEKDGKLVWSSSPDIYKPKVEATCDAECLADRAGIAQGEAEASEAKTFFPKWVLDAQKAFSNLVLSRAQSAFGAGKYNFETPMPTLTKTDLENPSMSNFSGYKISLKNWSDSELVNLKRENHETGQIKLAEPKIDQTKEVEQGSSTTSKIDQTKEVDQTSSVKPSIKMEVLNNSNKKFLVMVYSNVANKKMVVVASKKGTETKTIYIQTDEAGFGSLLSSQKLAGHAFSIAVDGKVKARASIKK